MKPKQENLKNVSSFVGSRQFKPASMQLGSSTTKKSKIEVVENKPLKESFSQTLPIKKQNFGAKSQVQLTYSLNKNAVDHHHSNYHSANNHSVNNQNINHSISNKKISLEQNIEEQYIKGLQDEVKLLEYELKLLKDRETEEQTNYTSFQKYFNDGIPINDNIIAMKNVYSNTQRSLADKKQILQQQLDEVELQNQAIEEETLELEERYSQLEEFITKNEDKYEKDYVNVENRYFDELYFYKESEPEQKLFQKKAREYQAEINLFNRNKDKEALIAGKKQIMDQQALEKIKKQVLYIESTILEKMKDLDNKKNTQQFEHETLFLEEQNELLTKRIQAMKTDLSMVEDKIKEFYEILKTQDIERKNNVNQRLTLVHKIFELKEQIEDQQKMTEGLIKQKVKELERDKVRKVEQDIEHNQKRQVNLVDDRIDTVLKAKEDIEYNKEDLDKEFVDLEIEEDILDQRMKDAKEKNHELKVEIEIATFQEKEIAEEAEPIAIRINTLKDLNPKKDKKVRDLEEKIKKAEQQLDLINQFKNFNIEEAKMAYQSNNQINSSISRLVQQLERINNSDIHEDN